ncbi:CRISPR-associated helicase/endonuclease Cas3 [Clostridium formicaceticum]|uniref:CRISPR-associated helicase/endonuclease Cas3 n=1 Tax=Clostridium formicaceticum TaxID=1497 RepID=A0AAC9RN73_9CLOT|nr:CRISPR-associated helicase/endonuclease Cas3 [Clostridium formicaceticum]AOY77480.1 CRISPR-associated helicase/endonuclease Cas3 [Clostridium formicaceticum]ARE88043.1 CRISPR-associated nuclease/helicase Cas3 [Clostridium formicaceticum]
MNRYLAKSNPQETIQQHTDHLLKNYNILKSIYPNLEINWDILYLACLYHDLGKMNIKFQQKIESQEKIEGEIPHGILSLAFINAKALKDRGFNDDEIKILAHAVAYHHEREFNFDNHQLKEEIKLIEKEAENFMYEKIKDIQVKKLGAKYFAKDRIYQKDNEKMFFNYILVKGLLNRIDYAASGDIDVEKPNDFLMKSLSNLMEEWQEKDIHATWNDLQKHMLSHKEDNIIAIAETGMGKTEAGLQWIGDQKGFFTLPLKTAINAMYDRVAGKIIKEGYEDKVGLLHSDTYSEYLNKDLEEVDIDEYYNKTKQLSLPLTICTLDQVFDFVYRYRGFESKLATLAYSKTVIDEVQMYSSDLLAYLIIGLSYITKIGGKFAILTATLPNLVIDLLKEEGIDFIPPKTFTNNDRVRHSVKIIREQMNTDYIINLYNKNKVLVICNTVKEAQRVYKNLKIQHKVECVNLFHSNFIKKDRKEKEHNILSIGNKDSSEYGIWVTTQVVEASLDIDFDILITELSDLNGLFQRMGRCYRSRQFNESGYNCYVFDGGDKECSGVGYVIDKDIFQLSKEALRNIDGQLKEEDKMKLVSNLYTTENLKNTKYYKLIKANIDYVKSIEDHEKCKNEVKKIFRNINSMTVIPKEVYNKNLEVISSYIDILSKEYDKAMSKKERGELKGKKVIARSKLMDFTLSVPYHKTKENLIKSIKLNRYETIPILNCKYSSRIGVEYIEKDRFKEDSIDYFI